MKMINLKMLGKNVVVFGGTGFVGRGVVNELSKQGYHVKVAVRRLERHRDFLLFPKTQLVELKELTSENIANLIEDADIVFNLYADMTAQSENMPLEEMVEATKTIKNAIDASNVQRFLSLSQLDAMANDDSNEYSSVLGRMDELVMTIKKAGVTIAKPSMLIGVGDQTTAIISKQMKIQPFLLAIVNPDTEVQPLAIKDFSKAFVSTLKDDSTLGKKLIFAGDSRLSIKDLAKMIKEMMGVKPAFIFSVRGFRERFHVRLGRLSLFKSISENFVVTLKKDLVTEEKFADNFGFNPASLEQTLIAYVVDPSMRERYNYFRKDAGRNVEDLAYKR